MLRTKVSVVIPVYNNATGVHRAINSAYEQTLPISQVIVVDDGSTDQLNRELEKYKKRKNFAYVHQENQGQGAARNLGVNYSQTDWVAFLDSDDWWHPEKIEVQINHIKHNSSAVLSYTNTEYLRNNFHYKYAYPSKWFSNAFEGNHYNNLIRQNCITTSSTLVKKDVFFSIGGFNPSNALRDVEDYDLWLRLARGYSFVGSNRPLTYYSYSEKKDLAYRKRIFNGLRKILITELKYRGNYTAKHLLIKRLALLKWELRV